MVRRRRRRRGGGGLFCLRWLKKQKKEMKNGRVVENLKAVVEGGKRTIEDGEKIFK